MKESSKLSNGKLETSSHDGETTIKSHREGNVEILFTGGSYNPENNPENGKNWEYYDVNHIIWDGATGKVVKTVPCYNEQDGNKAFNEMMKIF